MYITIRIDDIGTCRAHGCKIHVLRVHFWGVYPGVSTVGEWPEFWIVVLDSNSG